MEHLGGEILRSAQKDTYYVTELRDNVWSVLVDVFGPRILNNWEKWTEPCARFLYYLLTSLSDYQTLGEEYAGLVQSQGGRYALPSPGLRTLFMVLRCFGATAVEAGLQKLEKSDLGKKHAKNISTLRSVLTWLESINKCLFYYQGIYLELGRRLTGIQYLKVGNQLEDTKSGFRLLGHVATLHLLINMALSLYKLKQDEKVAENNKRRGDDTGPRENISSHQCYLCLDPMGTRGGSAATLCGHSACWTCLLETATVTGECPVCRASCAPNLVIPLHNL